MKRCTKINKKKKSFKLVPDRFGNEYPMADDESFRFAYLKNIVTDNDLYIFQEVTPNNKEYKTILRLIK